MTGLDIFAIIVLIVMVAFAVIVFVVLATLPGKIARQRNHPQAEAINIGSWLGLLFGGVLWPLVLIWAYAKPMTTSRPANATSADEIARLQARLSALEQALATRDSTKP